MPTRRYTILNKKKTLVSWIQQRCIRCGRFLSLYGKKYCPRCHKDNVNNYKARYYDYDSTKYRLYHKTQTFIRNHAEDLKIGECLESHI